MSNKKLDIQLSGAELPQDLFTETLGSNYGMDGYPDMNYGMGALEGVLDPEFTEPPALPTGVTAASAEGMDISGLIGEEITNLDWLDPTQLQDPERLPKDPHQAIPDLERAWGAGLETNGHGVRERDLTTARYEQSLADADPQGRKATATQMKGVVTHAMRRSAAGQNIDVIVKEALESMGEEMGRIAGALRAVRSEHGLAGNVLIRVSAYPGYDTGKWSKALRKTSARYVVVSSEQLKQATWIQNGRCAYTGKIAVTQVPWKKALSHYKPRLESVGRKVASGDPREALKAAFLSLPEKRQAEAWHTQHSEMKREGFLEVSDTPNIEPPEARIAKSQAEEAESQINRWARDGFFSVGVRDQILQSPASPQKKVQAAVALIKVARTQAFSGAINQGADGSRRLLDSRRQDAAQRVADRQERLNDRAAHEQQAADARTSRPDREMSRAIKQAEEWLQKNSFSGAPNQGQAGDILAREARREAQKSRSAQEQGAWDKRMEERAEKAAKQAALKVARVIKSGLRGARLKDEIRRLIPRELVGRATKYIDPLLRKTGALAEPKGPATYEGARFERHVVKKQASGIFLEVRSALKYARKSMSEGFAGKDLNSLLERRFPERIRSAMESDLTEIREAHEGGAGFLYVDAEAYASPTGVTGCEQGALRHRANQIPAVTQMERCATCNLVRTLEDGTKKCGAYNKALLEDTTGTEMDRMRFANLRVANMDDQGHTASMFAPAFDPDEFGLRNSNLEGISMEQPEYAELDISFGSWDALTSE